MNKLSAKEKFSGFSLFALFFSLIISGIVAKRGYDHPDWMVFFHLPAAIFLVLSARVLSRPFRERYQRELQKYAKRNELLQTPRMEK